MRKHIGAACVATVISLGSLPAGAANLDGLARKLDALEQDLDAGRLHTWSNPHYSLREALYGPEAPAEGTAGLKQARGRLLAIEQKLMERAGPRAKQAFGDGTRVTQADPEALELVDEAISSCRNVGERGTEPRELEEQVHKQLDRAARADATVLRYSGPVDIGVMDVPVSLALCELALQEQRLSDEDVYPYAKVERQRFSGCGYVDYGFQSIEEHPGTGRYGAWQSIGTPIAAQQLDCKKFPKPGAIPADIKKSFKREFPGLSRKDVVVMSAPVDVEMRGIIRVKTATVRIYSQDTSLTTTTCGSTDPKLVCEASGSRGAAAYNQLQHFVRRGELHRDAGRVERCKAMNQEALKVYEEFEQFHKESLANGSWTTGLTYKTLDGTMDQEKLLAGLRERGQQAEERAIGKWCSKG